MLPLEDVYGSRDHHRGDGWKGRHPQLSCHDELHLGDVGLGLFQDGRELLDVRDEPLAGRRQQHAAPAPLDELDLQLVLKLSDLLGHRGRRDAQRVGNRRHGGAQRKLAQRPQAHEVHEISPVRTKELAIIHFY